MSSLHHQSNVICRGASMTLIQLIPTFTSRDRHRQIFSNSTLRILAIVNPPKKARSPRRFESATLAGSCMVQLWKNIVFISYVLNECLDVVKLVRAAKKNTFILKYFTTCLHGKRLVRAFIAIFIKISSYTPSITRYEDDIFIITVLFSMQESVAAKPLIASCRWVNLYL